MSIRRPITCLALFAATFASFTPEAAHAGPLLDWLFGHHRASGPAYPVGQPVPVGTTANMPVTSVPMAGAPAVGYGAAMPVTQVPLSGYPASGYAANYGNYYGSRMPVVGPSGYGYPAMQPNGITAATAPTIMSYVPDYRTTQYRAPVTYYRPLMTTDPNTGAQVVALAPCTSYEYQTQRVPTFGYNGVLGSYSTPPVVPAPPSMPTYTLPSGGVPLAAGGAPAVLAPNTNSYAMGYGGYSTVAPSYSQSYSQNYAPSYSQSYSSNYGSYMPQQSGLTAPPMGTYPTQPMTSNPGYYGSVSGGSTGSYAAPTYNPSLVTPGLVTPGLVAPQGPAMSTTPYPSNAYPAPSTSPSTSPSYQPTTPSYPINPPSGSPGGFSDPSGDMQPVLPPNLGASNERSQLRAIVRQPMTANSSLNANSGSSNPLDSARSSQQVQQPTAPRRESSSPALEPIPVPENMEQQPRWNPGLLKAEDRTALRPSAPNNAQPTYGYAGQAKTIQWASFNSDAKATDTGTTSHNQQHFNQLDFSQSVEPAKTVQPPQVSGLRAIAAPTPAASSRQPAAQPQPAQPRPARQTGGWNVVK